MSVDRNTVLNLAYISTDINEYLMTLYNLVVQGDYKEVVELGCGYSTVALLAGVNKTGGQLYSCDMSRDSLNRSGLLDQIREDPRLHYVEMDDMEFVKMWGKPIDFLFHDTSHTYEHTKAELLAWTPFVRRGGMIFAHDMAHETGIGMGCRKAYDEFMKEHTGEYVTIQLLDTKIIGSSVSFKL